MINHTTHSQAQIDKRFMAAAIRLARRNVGQTGTNPSVACVLVKNVDGDLIIVGSGVTSIGGRPHAEPIALLEAGELAKGATAYVTLEPCAHHGATPPCAATLINAGVSRVVTSLVDPDDRVNEAGHKMLRDAGITVEAGCLENDSAQGLNAYVIHKGHNRAQVTVKIALSADGYLGIKGNGQVAITGPYAKRQTHLLRAKHHAILVGAQTIIEDDPDLTCRLSGMENKSPIRLVLDPNSRVPLAAKVFQTSNQVKTYVVAPNNVDVNRRQALAKLGVEIINCQLVEAHIALPELLEDLGARGIQSVMVEGGAKTVKAFLDAKLIDEFVILRGPNNIAQEGKVLIATPIIATQLPNEYSLVEKLNLGEDVLKHYIKTHNQNRN